MYQIHEYVILLESQKTNLVQWGRHRCDVCDRDLRRLLSTYVKGGKLIKNYFLYCCMMGQLTIRYGARNLIWK